jgi:class 3 adenylate cyclase/Tfp pilus assembly protein PilF
MRLEELQAKLELARIAFGSSDYKEVQHQANDIILQLDEQKDAEEEIGKLEGIRAHALLFLSGISRIYGEHEVAKKEAQSAISIIEKFHLHDMKRMAYTVIGQLNQTNCAYDMAIHYFMLADSANEKYGDETRAAGCKLSLGIVYENICDYNKSLEYYSESLSLHKKFNNKSGIAQVLGNIALVYTFIGQHDTALDYYNLALNHQSELGDESEIALVLGNLGVEYFNIANYDKAYELFNKALTAHEKLNQRELIAKVNGNIGNVYSATNQYDKALEYYSKAMKDHEEINNKEGKALCLGNIGQIYANKNYKLYSAAKAETYLFDAIDIFNTIGSKYLVYNFHKTLADLYKEEKRWEECNQHLEKHYVIEKEVLSEEATKQAQQLENRRKVEEAERDRQLKLARFQEQEKILLNILPARIAERILEGEKLIADMHEEVSIFFSDIVGFTDLSQNISPEELLALLNEIFTAFDKLTHKHGLEKIKTIGDAYMAVAGVPLAQKDHAERAASFALDAIEYMKSYQKKSGTNLQIRIGLHCGRAIAGVIGENKFVFDLWGDSVNTASRMESHGEPGKIHVSHDFRNTLTKTTLHFIDRGEMVVKGKGMMKTYFLEGN